MDSHLSSHRLLFRLLVVMAAITIVAAACGGSGGGSDVPEGAAPNSKADEGTPQAGGTMTVGLESESTGWQPCTDSSINQTVARAIYDPLMSRAEDGTLRPYLAESLVGNDVATEWTLKLRPGVKFHDGTALDSAALAANFADIKLPASKCSALYRPVNEMQVIDPLTVKYVLAAPYGPFPELLSHTYFPYSPANVAKWGLDASSHPVGTGPFVFDTWQRDSTLNVRKNMAYWQKGKPYLDSITFRPISDEDARLASLQTGETQLSVTLRQEYVRQARNLGDAVKRYEFIGNNCGGSVFNVVRAPVNDKRIRRAFAYSLNQENLVKILGGEGISPPCRGYFAKSSPWYNDAVAALWPHDDVAKGKALVDQYKADPQRSDGKPVGAEVVVEWNCPPDPTLIAVGQGYQQMATAVGLKVNLNQIEAAAGVALVTGKPPYTDADYQSECWRFSSNADPDTLFYNTYNDPNNNAANYTNFTTPELQAQLKIGRESKDLATRKKAYDEVGRILADEVPFMLTGNTATSIVSKLNVNGYASWPFPEGTVRGISEEAVVRFSDVWLKK